MKRPEVVDLVRDRLADILEVEPDQINEGDSFADDLDAVLADARRELDQMRRMLSLRSADLGLSEQPLAAWIPAWRLMGLGCAAMDLRTVADAIGAENRNIAAGNVTSSSFDVRARVDGRFLYDETVLPVLITGIET